MGRTVNQLEAALAQLKPGDTRSRARLLNRLGREQIPGDCQRALETCLECQRLCRDAGLEPCLRRIGGLSYPSGHSTIAHVFALILADLVPERRAEFLARADAAALNRVIGGVHHPSDIEAGKRLADLLYAEFLKSPAFRADQEALQQYLKPK